MFKKLQYYASIAPTKKPPSTTSTLEELFQSMQAAEIPYKNEAVYYDGDSTSPIMIVGEAPGADEVLQKKPFVGKSGQLLQNMFDAAGMSRDSLYVTNAIVWRPPSNRTPLPEEIEAMRPFLLRHVELIKPKILILVGGVATKCFNGADVAISKIRGQWRSGELCENVMSIFHPSFLLRSRIHKKETWADILKIREKVIAKGLGHIVSKNSWLVG